MPTPSNNKARHDLVRLRNDLHALVNQWRRRANAAERGGMPQIAMDYHDCADELLTVARGGRR